ncbi:MAG TPA: ACP S-malonyltransferase [Bacteroidales bacterium]|nr:ACP S-malonyltransferase [Bacteroidales bacterium]HCI56254.1 [acyl-carrier-protein] S-malonyltransferase [Bacteroidales bacterium]HOU95895.1 ACP S-malonyltransferase [Bacteroidales bacterium]HQG35876.1 ACP S-malonyltransferase [Bacteroidales bacterium]HQG52386.1 ACP S-malonyltransferase [Bacteroidales bacterium]
MKAYVFPGQGSQYPGMGKDLYEKYPLARELFEKANSIVGYRISDVMFYGSEEDLKQTRVTQPAIFLHSVIIASVVGESFMPDMVAGHSLGEFSALVANRTLTFEDGLMLVLTRASAMQRACEMNPSTMAAILGLDDNIVEEVCAGFNGEVVPANYNSPGQIVISGTNEAIDKAIEILKSRGAKRALKLSVGGAFHSPLMEPARKELEEAINKTSFRKSLCPIFQNVNAKPSIDPEEIKANLVMQLTSPVRWSQTIINMIKAGATSFTEVGPGNVLQGLIKKINKDAITESIIV